MDIKIARKTNHFEMMVPARSYVYDFVITRSLLGCVETEIFMEK